MKLVALVQTPRDPEAAADVLAKHAGIAPAEAKMRLAPEPPALLARLADEPAAALASALTGFGLAAITCDAIVPTDAQRTLARTFELGPEGMRFVPREGSPLSIAYSAMALVLRGVRVSRSTTTHTESHTHFSAGKAILSGGLAMTSTSKREVQSHAEDAEHFVLVYGSLGECGAVYDSRAAFACLGPKVQPTKLGNIQLIAGELKARAPKAFHDDRLLRLGRRSLPFTVGREMHAVTGGVTTTRVEGSSTVDVLAELLLRAALAGLLTKK